MVSLALEGQPFVFENIKVTDKSRSEAKVGTTRVIDVKGPILTRSGNVHMIDARVFLKKKAEGWRIDSQAGSFFGFGRPLRRDFTWEDGWILYRPRETTHS